MPDAVIMAKRLDMAPDSMPTMTTPLEPLPSTEPGRIRTNGRCSYRDDAIECVSASAGAKQARPLLPQSYGPAGHLSHPEEGLDGDGLHRRL